MWYGPDAMLSSIDLLLEDKRAAVEYDVAADASVRPGTTYPNCQVGAGCRAVCVCVWFGAFGGPR